MGRKNKQTKKCETPKKQVQVRQQQSQYDSFMHEQQAQNQQKLNQEKKDGIKQGQFQQNEESHVEIIAEIQNESSDESQQIQSKNKKSKTKIKKKYTQTKDRRKRNKKVGAYPKFDDKQLKSKYESIVGDANKSSSFQNLIIDSILQEGFQGQYKYFLASLRNNKLVYIKQSDVILYFPRKLVDYYLRVLAKIAKSTHQIPVRN